MARKLMAVFDTHGAQGGPHPGIGSMQLPKLTQTSIDPLQLLRPVTPESFTVFGERRLDWKQYDNCGARRYVLAGIRELLAVLLWYDRDVFLRIYARIIFAMVEKIVIRQQDAVVAIRSDAVADRAFPEIGAQATVILRIVIPLPKFADLGNVSDSDNCPLIIVGKRRALCVDEDQTVSVLECVKKRIE